MIRPVTIKKPKGDAPQVSQVKVFNIRKGVNEKSWQADVDKAINDWLAENEISPDRLQDIQLSVHSPRKLEGLIIVVVINYTAYFEE